MTPEMQRISNDEERQTDTEHTPDPRNVYDKAIEFQ